MSVSARFNPTVVIGCLATVVLVAGLFAYAQGGSPDSQDRQNVTQIHVPERSLDIVRSSTPARSSVGVSRRLFASSPTVVLASRSDRRAQRIAITSAMALGVPVLVDDSSAPAELKRLGAETVLTFGRTRTMPGARAVAVDATQAAAEITRLRGTSARRTGRHIKTIVVTRSRAANAAAVANARIAGADVLQIPSADPRRSPAAARWLAARPEAPVIAIGAPFVRNFAYTLSVVRRDIIQPTGGYLALPGKHYTAMYGHPGAPSLGVLGEQGIKASIRRVKRLAHKYQAVSDAAYVPTFEIIATVASGGAGKDKNYSQEAPIKTLTPLIDAAEKVGIYVILDLQPGRTDFLTQAKRYRSLLERPHVGLALDPEWRLKKGQKHLRQIGSVQVSEINRVGDWLARLTRRKVLPQKIFVLHQFSPRMIKHRSRLDTGHAELATVIHVDGSGPQGAKQGTWKLLRKNAPKGVHWGWKNFVDEDKPMLTAPQTLRQVKPRPDLVSYQ